MPEEEERKTYQNEIKHKILEDWCSERNETHEGWGHNAFWRLWPVWLEQGVDISIPGTIKKVQTMKTQGHEYKAFKSPFQYVVSKTENTTRL